MFSALVFHPSHLLATRTRRLSVVFSYPLQVLKSGSNPGPLTELEFWTAKAANLNAIHDQLNGPKIQKVMQILEASRPNAPHRQPPSIRHGVRPL